MKINYSRHARRQMKWREITEDEVKNTIREPEKIEYSTKGRKNALKHINEKWIKVTFKEEDGIIIIITVMDKNK